MLGSKCEDIHGHTKPICKFGVFCKQRQCAFVHERTSPFEIESLLGCIEQNQRTRETIYVDICQQLLKLLAPSAHGQSSLIKSIVHRIQAITMTTASQDASIGSLHAPGEGLSVCDLSRSLD